MRLLVSGFPPRLLVHLLPGIRNKDGAAGMHNAAALARATASDATWSTLGRSSRRLEHASLPTNKLDPEGYGTDPGKVSVPRPFAEDGNRPAVKPQGRILDFLYYLLLDSYVMVLGSRPKVKQQPARLFSAACISQPARHIGRPLLHAAAFHCVGDRTRANCTADL